MPHTAPDPWEEFCEQLKRAGHVLRREATPKDDLTLAEGYRKLVRLIRIGFDATVEFADVEHPQVYQSVTPTALGEGESADARYHQAFIDGSSTYRLSGRRGSAPLIEFTVYAGKIGMQETSRQISALTEREFQVDADGRFNIVLSPHAHAGNWMRTEPDANLLYIRQYAHGWGSAESATFDLRKEGAGPQRAPLKLDAVLRGLTRTAAFVDHAVHFWAGIVDRRTATEPNVFHEIPVTPDPGRPTMPAGHRFSSGYFRLAADEALLATFTPTEVPYWGLDLTNYWFEPLSYAEQRSNLNNRTVRYEEDGSVRIIIAAERPAAGNWLDTRGHREGTMLFRWSRSSDPPPPIATRVVKLATT